MPPIAAAPAADTQHGLAPVMAHLDHCRVDFCFSHHPNPSSGPTLNARIVMADGRPWLVLAAERVDLAQVGRAVRARKVAPATATQLATFTLPHVPSGFGRLHGLKTILDASLLDHLFVRVPTGVEGVCVELGTDDLAAMERPVIASITGQKKQAAAAEPEAMAIAG